MREMVGGKVLLVSIFEDDHDGGLEVDARNLRHVKGLPVPVFENDSDRAGVAGCGSSPGKAAGGGKHEYGRESTRLSQCAWLFSRGVCKEHERCFLDDGTP